MAPGDRDRPRGNRVRHYLVGLTVAGVTCLLGVLPGAALASASIDTVNRTVTTSKLALQFGATDPERIDSLKWTDSSGTQTGNLATEGGSHCSDSQEYWGESYAFPESAAPDIVVGGAAGTWGSPQANQVQIQDQSTPGCGDVIPVTTTYTFFDTGAQANEFKVERNVSFSNNSYAGTEGFRAYTPRVPVSTYDQVLYPNAQGQLQQAGVCDNCATISDWSGGWFADNASSTNSGMIVLRDTADTQPAHLAIDQDSYSGSNNTAVELLQPSGGWSSPVDEIEYLCFYDATSWPVADRPGGQSATLPAGCGSAPAVTSASGTSFAAGSAGSFTVTSTGTPTASLSESGTLPSGVTFTDNGNGTATLSGTAPAGSQGSYPVTITAHSSFGQDTTQSFTLTITGAPKATTSPAGNVTTSSATVHGTVNPEGLSTTYYFQYGTSAGYGSQTASASAGSATGDQAVTASLSGLAPQTTYHYRIVAQNSAGTAYGADQTFQTAASPPTTTTSQPPKKKAKGAKKKHHKKHRAHKTKPVKRRRVGPAFTG